MFFSEKLSVLILGSRKSADSSVVAILKNDNELDFSSSPCSNAPTTSPILNAPNALPSLSFEQMVKIDIANCIAAKVCSMRWKIPEMVNENKMVLLMRLHKWKGGKVSFMVQKIGNLSFLTARVTID